MNRDPDDVPPWRTPAEITAELHRLFEEVTRTGNCHIFSDPPEQFLITSERGLAMIEQAFRLRRLDDLQIIDIMPSGAAEKVMANFQALTREVAAPLLAIGPSLAEAVERWKEEVARSPFLSIGPDLAAQLERIGRDVGLSYREDASEWREFKNIVVVTPSPEVDHAPNGPVPLAREPWWRERSWSRHYNTKGNTLPARRDKRERKGQKAARRRNR